MTLAILPGNGLPVALHSSSVEKPIRMVWLMISPVCGMLGGSEGKSHMQIAEVIVTRPLAQNYFFKN